MHVYMYVRVYVCMCVIYIHTYTYIQVFLARHLPYEQQEQEASMRVYHNDNSSLEDDSFLHSENHDLSGMYTCISRYVCIFLHALRSLVTSTIHHWKMTRSCTQKAMIYQVCMYVPTHMYVFVCISVFSALRKP
jgi:hypothetical protein